MSIPNRSLMNATASRGLSTPSATARRTGDDDGRARAGDARGLVDRFLHRAAGTDDAIRSPAPTLTRGRADILCVRHTESPPRLESISGSLLEVNSRETGQGEPVGPSNGKPHQKYLEFSLLSIAVASRLPVPAVPPEDRHPTRGDLATA